MTGSTDANLTERLLERDEGALREVIDRYGGAVHGMARRVIADAALAEEVAQDTFVALWRRPGAFDPQRGSLQAFLSGIARNKAIDLVRREQARRNTAETLIEQVRTDRTLEPDDRSLRLVDERHHVLSALNALSPAQRDAIVLAFYGGRTYREVARELSIPEGTAKTRLRDGLNRLRSIMDSQEGTR